MRVDMFERMAMPYGLVRYGVAPDHQSIKRVVRSYEATARPPGSDSVTAARLPGAPVVP